MDFKKFQRHNACMGEATGGFWMIFSAAWLVLALYVFITPYPWAIAIVACLLFCAGCLSMFRESNTSKRKKIAIGTIMSFAILLSTLYSVPILMYGFNPPTSWITRSTAEGMIVCPNPEYSIVQGIEISLQKGIMDFTLKGNCLMGTSNEEITEAGMLRKCYSNHIFICSNCIFPGYIMCDVDEINFYCHKSSDFCGEHDSFVLLDRKAIISQGPINISGKFFDVHVECFEKEGGKIRCDLYFEGVGRPSGVHGYQQFLGYEQGDNAIFSNESSPFGYFIKSSELMFLYDRLCGTKYLGGKNFYEKSGEINVTEKQVLFREKLSERWLKMNEDKGRELTPDELEDLLSEIASELSIKPMLEMFNESYNRQISGM